MASAELRYVLPDDHDTWLGLWAAYHHFSGTEVPAETSAVTWQRFLDPREPMYAALAWRDHRAIGLVHFLFHRTCWTVGDHVYLNDIFVGQDQRGKGVGRQMIEFVYDEAFAKGASRVYWMTHQDNNDARRLYDRVASKTDFVIYRRKF